MAAVTAQLELIRGEKAPETPYDPRRERVEQRRRTQAQTAQTQTHQNSGQTVQEEGLGK
jgi:hypothetical protein